jgi:hypothetical protein
VSSADDLKSNIQVSGSRKELLRQAAGQKIKQVFFLYRGQRARDESGMCA